MTMHRAFKSVGWLSLACFALAGTVRTEVRSLPTLGSELVWIAPGTFEMGSPPSEAGHRADESPLTRVTLTKGFWMSRYEVTYGQWRKLMHTTLLEQARRALESDRLYFIGRKEYIPLRDFFGWKKGDDPGELIGGTEDNRPMVWVSWEEAVAFCKKLTAIERAAGRVPANYEYRLPTEAEWEYACRAGTSGATYAGDMILRKDRTAPVLEKIAVYAGNTGEGYTAHPVGTAVWPNKKWPYKRGGPPFIGSKLPNAWGLYDMLGSAAEWCLDWNGPLPGGHVTDPVGPPTGKYHVRKGGSWSSLATQTRAAYRNWHEPSYRWMNLGFRVVLAPAVD